MCVFMSLLQSEPDQRNSGASTWGASGSVKYLRFQGCDLGMQSHLPLFWELDSGEWALWLSALSTFICPPSHPHKLSNS